ncbi:MAG: DoxX family protein [Halobacteriales archaeon]
MATESESKTRLRTGHEKYLEVSERWSGLAVLTMRLLIGWQFLLAGIIKFVVPNWSAKPYLIHGVPEANPFVGFFTAMAKSSWMPIINGFNMWGLTLVGLALILGVAVRFSAFWGGVVMWFYWASSLPLENSVFVNEHIVYIALLFFLGAFGAGRYYGLDKYIEDMQIVEDNPWLRYLLG